MKKYVLSIGVWLIVTASSIAYPITPRPLRKLIQESEYIVMAHVIDLHEQRGKKDDFWSGYIAVLRIREVLKGRIKDTMINVSYSPNMICPAPPHFEKNTDVMAFLDKGDKTFHVHALSYGVKTLNEEGMNVYKMRVKDMQEILLLSDTDEQFLKTTEWLVKCVEHSETRYEGVYELSRDSDFMSHYDRSEGQPFQFALTVEQKNRLYNVLLASSPLSYSDLGLIDLVYADHPDEVYALMLQGIRSISQDNYWMAGAYMNRLMHYKSSDHLKTLADDFESKVYSLRPEESHQLKTIINEFLVELEKE